MSAKKTTLWVLLICLLFTFHAAMAEGETVAPSLPENLTEGDIIGEWELYALRMEGQSINPAVMGIFLRIEFGEDHRVQGSFAGTLGDSGHAEETWSLDAGQGLILVSGQPYLKVRSEDGTLFLLMDEEISDQAGSEMIFTRVQQE